MSQKGKKNEVVLCDDGGEKKRKKSFKVTHAVVTALGSAHCNCLSLCRKGKQQQEQIHHRVKGKSPAMVGMKYLCD